MIAVVLCPGALACGSRTTIRVANQKDFDGLGSTILDCLANGKSDIVVDFAKGQYYYNELHLYYNEVKYPDASILFKGNGATIISSGRNLVKDASPVPYIEGAGFIDTEGRDCLNYGHMFHSDGLVEILDEKTKKCMIHSPELEGFGGIDCSNSYIRLTSWYTSYLYHVDKIVDGKVFFTADNLAPGYAQYGGFNVNYDFSVGKNLPRFRLVNLPIGGCGIVSTPRGLLNQTSENVVHQCEAGRFVFLQNCELKHLTLEGFNIIGGRADGQLIRFRNVKAQSIVIRRSSMSAVRGVVIYGEKTDNITVEKCEFHDNYKDIISLSNTCGNAVISRNQFHDNGKGVINSFCIICRGGNYKVFKNEIRDFNYGAIGIGVWHGSAKGSQPSYGVVEKNHIYYTPDYIADKANWTLVDGGAIYLWSKNDGAVIRNNFIHDYEGMGSNRGIYGDDGTSNCAVYENIILNIGSGFSIDLRRSLTLDKLNVGLKSNENNTIYGNTFNNRFRFQGRGDDASSVKGGNTVLLDVNGSKPRIEEENLIERSKDKVTVFDEKKWFKKGRRIIR